MKIASEEDLLTLDANTGKKTYRHFMLKTEDIHPPKTGISVHFSGSLV